MGSYCKLSNFSLREFYEIKTGSRRKCESKRRLDGQVVVITGANTGIAKVTALELSLQGAKVIIGCRDLEKGMSAINDIKEKNPDADISVIKLDLASLKSVREFANNIKEQETRIDILINNAGIMACPEKQTTDGFEMQFGTNHLGHFLLTLHLLPLLKNSPKARVLTVASSGHLGGHMHLDNINLRNGAYTEFKAYAQSKLANVLFSRELAKRLGPDSHIKTYSLHPGPINTELQRNMNSALGDAIMKIMGLTPEEGAQTTLYCALEESLDNETGQFYANCEKVTKMISSATDDETAQRLWDLSSDLVDIEPHLRI